MMVNDCLSVLLCGVGGQGTVLAADILAKVVAHEGLDVKVSEIHGMSQRGGSVVTFVRFGTEVHAPLLSYGDADHIVAFEATEALRYLPYLAPAGKMLVNSEEIKPLPVLIESASMPENTLAFLKSRGALIIDALKIASSLENPKGTNIVLLGALSIQLPFPESTWDTVIESRVPPQTIAANMAAFKAGRTIATC